MTLYSYIVKDDTGFAPNPFFGYCTLACCKPGIRRTAKKKDWIVGLTPKAQEYRIVYVMQVDKIMGFDEYWKRFKRKRPDVHGGVKQKNGDNIYEPSAEYSLGYHQHPSAHSDGDREDAKKKKRDLAGRSVLVSRKFAYFGSNALELPQRLVCLIVGRGHRCHFKPDVLKYAVSYLGGLQKRKPGIQAPPRKWPGNDKSWSGSTCGSR